MQVAEVELLPEAAAEAVAYPAGDGEHPQADGGARQTQHPLVCTAGKQKGHDKGKKIIHVCPNIQFPYHKKDVTQLLSLYTILSY